MIGAYIKVVFKILFVSFVADNEKSGKSVRNHHHGFRTSSVEENAGEESIVTVDIKPYAAPVKVKEQGNMSKQGAGLTGKTPSMKTENFSKFLGKWETPDRPEGNCPIITASDTDIAEEQLLTICKQLSNIKPPGIYIMTASVNSCRAEHL